MEHKTLVKTANIEYRSCVLGLLSATNHDELGEKAADLELHVGNSEQSAHLLSTSDWQARLKQGGQGE